MRRLLALVSFFWALITTATAQTDISGTVTDKTSGTPLEFANVVAYTTADTTFITGATTDSQGRYKLSGLQLPVVIKVSMIGYTTHTQAITHEGEQGNIALEADTRMLKEVTVTGQLIKQSARGYTTTIQNTPLAKLPTLNDVLGQLPFLAINGDKVEVFDRGTPIYYINNRRVRNTAELTDLLPSNIKNVEVITSPGVQYPAGTGAVIRITIHRPQGEGWSGTFNEWASIDYELTTQTRAQLNYRHGGLDIFGGASIYAPNSKGTSRSEITNGRWQVKSEGTTRNKDAYWAPTVGVNYILGGKHYMGAQYWLNISTWKKNAYGVNSFAGYRDGVQTQYTVSHPSYCNKMTSHYGNMYYRWEIAQRHALQIDVDMSAYNGTGAQQQDLQYSHGVGQTLRLDDRNKSRFAAGKVVYSLPINKVDMNMGAEASHSRVSAEQGKEGDKETPLTPTDNVSIQNNYAAFIEASFRMGNWYANIGARLEHVNFNYYLNNRYDTDVSQRYTRLYPSVALAYANKDFQASVTYTYHIVQPTYSELNNTFSYQNDYIYSIGNPLIRNSFYHNIAYKLSWRNLQIMGSYRKVTNRIVHTYEHMEGIDSVIVERALNLDGYQSFSIGLSYSPKVTKWWTPTMEVNFSKPFTKIDGISYNHPLWVGRWKNQVKLPAEFNLFLNMSYSSLAHANLTTRHQNFVADLRLTKSLLKNKLNLSLSANDLFNTSSRYRYTQIHDIMLIQDGSNTQRCIQLSVSYNLNSTRSKFRGTGAGSTERSRMAR